MPPRDPMEERIVGPGFHDKVYAVVRRVPAGRVTTYGDVATLLGSPRVARHVGWALAALRSDHGHGDVPWHRVINSRGAISARGQVWRATDQHLRLVAEGVVFDEAGRVDLRRFRWHPGSTDPTDPSAAH